MTLRITYAVATGQFRQFILDNYGNVVEAATDTMREAGDILKREARQSIAGAGFSRKWQNALRVDVYPRRGKSSINASVYLHHNIHYADIFEKGGTITGSPYLWLAMDNVPKKIGRGKMTPKKFPGKLYSIPNPGGPPLLGAPIRLTRSNARRQIPKLSLAALKRGEAGEGLLRTVPLFVGIRSVRIRKRFDIAGATARVRSQIPQIYIEKIKTHAS